MRKITIEISNSRAREWDIVLRDQIKHDAGKSVSPNTSLEQLIKAVILREVASELARQSEEAERGI